MIGVGNALTVIVFVAALLQPLLVTVYVIKLLPALTGVISPVPAPIVATPNVPLVHTPAGVVLEYVVVAPIHTPAEPLIAFGTPGIALIVTLFCTADALHPVAVIVSVTSTVPAPANPHVTVIVLVPVPAVILPPPTVHEYVCPPTFTTLYTDPVTFSHTEPEPVMIGVGKALTVIVFVAALLQPLPSVTVYVIKLLPALTGVISPVPAPIVATPNVPLVHTPAGVVLEYVVVAPIHTSAEPLIAFGVLGIALIVIVFVAALLQPLLVTVYVIKLLPALTGVISPVPAPIVATPNVPLVQTPAGVVLEYVVFVPIHVAAEPLIAFGTPGIALIVTLFCTADALHPVAVIVSLTSTVPAPANPHVTVIVLVPVPAVTLPPPTVHE